ncbi:hypothetical protein [Tumebacillus flagellatus]|uniref:hypothetical protein n=1 Tax=Tumebacillus flagellatus TaxID=1157490 RepID=UPI0012689524|nr:hypothetical protein [Tumebacillus flagellatus]
MEPKRYIELQRYIPESQGYRHVRISKIGDCYKAELQFGGFDSSYARSEKTANSVGLLLRQITEHDFPRAADSRLRRVAYSRYCDDLREEIERMHLSVEEISH